MNNLLGKWYAKEPHRYYQLTHKNIIAYKLYIIEQTDDSITYDSYYLTEDNELIASKVNQTSPIQTLQDEIDKGFLVRRKRRNVNEPLEETKL